MAVVPAVCALLAIAGAVQAALPPKGASFTFADHATAGKNWHVTFTVDAKSRKKLATLIVYSEQCNATVAKQGVPISDGGVVAASGGLKGGGTWAVSAVFKDTNTIVGTMRMTSAGCDTGMLNYPTAITGNGRGEHSHGGAHQHGPKYADFASASHRQRRQAVALQKRVLRKWSGMTLARAAHLGFEPSRRFHRKAGMFHVYNDRYERDSRRFDARRPESLVFWRPPHGAPVILGPMFRVPPGKRPSFAGPIPIYHSHESRSGKVVSQMTHVWLVKSATNAWAFCLPVKQLEAYDPAFKWLPGYSNHEHIGEPC